MHIHELSGKKVCILGFGREGAATLNALESKAFKCKVCIADQDPEKLKGIAGYEIQADENYLQGLDRFDRKILGVIRDQYNGGPVGIEALAATLNEETDTIVDVVEPYLLKIGFLRRTSRGREVTEKARQHL